jgi:hypothetical protein
VARHHLTNHLKVVDGYNSLQFTGFQALPFSGFHTHKSLRSKPAGLFPAYALETYALESSDGSPSSSSNESIPESDFGDADEFQPDSIGPELSILLQQVSQLAAHVTQATAQ